ncbi:MAG: lycopene cyclase family protein [Bacteroidota bacterium]
MDTSVYDYAIIGAGAAGLHLCLAMSEDPYFRSKKILILEKHVEKPINPTWCFWEKGEGKWDDLVDASWRKTAYITSQKAIEIALGSYTYKMVHGIDFFTKSRQQLRQKENITWIDSEVNTIEVGNPVKIITPDSTYLASHVFDSRIDPDFFQEKGKFTYLKQHFEGWVIESDQEIFDPEVFTMMDYRLIYPGTTSFIYILPVSRTKGLVEYTFFSPDLVDQSVYETYLKKYISEILNIENYQVVKKESSVIPMTDYPFHKMNNQHVTKIGTAGGWVKGSSGYSFKNAERKSQQIIDNIKKNKQPGHNLTKWRFRIYDMLFLDVLGSHNEIGPFLFDDMYYKNDIELILSFLDEETTFWQELRIMNTFNKWLFMKAIFKRLLGL